MIFVLKKAIMDEVNGIKTWKSEEVGWRVTGKTTKREEGSHPSVRFSFA